MEEINNQIYQSRIDNGYIRIKTDEGWIYFHVKIMEDFIGRKLNDSEVIHHINSNKQDNSIKNLLLFPNQKEHSKFHVRLKKFKYTQPTKTLINNLKLNMLKERQKNIIQRSCLG